MCLLPRSSGAGRQDEEITGCWNGFTSQKGRFFVLRCKTGPNSGNRRLEKSSRLLDLHPDPRHEAIVDDERLL